MRGLKASHQRLVDDYDLLMLDLDGVVYVGEEAVPGAVDNLRAARTEGAHVASGRGRGRRAGG